LVVGGAVASHPVYAYRLFFFTIGKLGIFRLEIHNPAERITAIDDRPRAKKNFGIGQGVGIDGDYILQVSTAKDSVVHANAIYGNKYRVGGKAPNHGAAPSKLTFLYKYFTGALQQVCRGLWVFKLHFPFINAGDSLGDFILALLSLTCRYKNFIHINSTFGKLNLKRTCLKSLICN